MIQVKNCQADNAGTKEEFVKSVTVELMGYVKLCISG